jgi:hypothetical protein
MHARKIDLELHSMTRFVAIEKPLAPANKTVRSGVHMHFGLRACGLDQIENCGKTIAGGSRFFAT